MCSSRKEVKKHAGDAEMESRHQFFSSTPVPAGMAPLVRGSFPVLLIGGKSNNR